MWQAVRQLHRQACVQDEYQAKEVVVRITLSVTKADIGSIGGHIAPSRRLLETVRDHIRGAARDVVIDSFVSHTPCASRSADCDRSC